MKLKPSLTPHQKANLLPVGLRTLGADRDFVPNGHPEGREHRGTCAPPSRPLTPRLLLFNDAFVRFTAVRVESWNSAALPACSNGEPCPGGWAEIRTVSSLWPSLPIRV